MPLIVEEYAWLLAAILATAIAVSFIAGVAIGMWWA